MRLLRAQEPPLLCLAYERMTTDGRVSVCGKLRGHPEPHLYEWLDVIEERLERQAREGGPP